MKKISRDKDFKIAFEKFLAEYKMDRIADVHDFLEKDAEYKVLNSSKIEKEKELQLAITDNEVSSLLLDYISSVDFMLDEFKTIYYEHGFRDCITVNKKLQKGIKLHLPTTIN
jgi:hypothetical protein